MAKFLGADIHHEILAIRVFAIEALDRILHRGCDADGEHELLDVMIHGRPRLSL